MNLRNGMQYGLIAQELETVLPTLVTTNTFPAEYDSAGTMISPSFHIKGLDYQQLIPIMIKAMQEQESVIDSLTNSFQAQIAQIVQSLASCCNNNQAFSPQGEARSSAHTTEIVLKDIQSVILEQNLPNPFAEQTMINYYLPENVTRAQMMFYNVQGRLIETVDLDGRGQGSINVFASDLSTGIYTYTLVVDGKVAESRKMVKQ